MMRHRSRLLAWVIASAAAATASTLVEIALWLAATDAFPGILVRDTRLAAAIVLGPRVLTPTSNLAANLIAVATMVHAALSLAYVAVMAWLVEGRSTAAAAVVGAAFGMGLFAVNMYAFTAIFPWFAAARDWITLAAHVVFGICGAVVYRSCAMHDNRF